MPTWRWTRRWWKPRAKPPTGCCRRTPPRRATARAADPLLIVIDVAKPRPSDIAVHVTSKSLRGEIVRIIGNVDGEIRRFVAAHVAGEIDSPGSQQAMVIDVAGQVASAWDQDS